MFRSIRHACGLALAASALLVTPLVIAQDTPAPQAQPKSAQPATPGNAADKADKAADKAADKMDKAADKMDKAADKAAEKMDKAADKAGEKLDEAALALKAKERELRAKAQRKALEVDVKSSLKGAAMTAPMKQELSRHARRIARLEVVKRVALDQKDQTSADQSTALLDKERARHDTWMKNFNPKAEQKVGAK
ncbi:MAG: hypothetical protein WKG00_18745 [Polyangiaceae bacterium]